MAEGGRSETPDGPVDVAACSRTWIQEVRMPGSWLLGAAGHSDGGPDGHREEAGGRPRAVLVGLRADDTDAEISLTELERLAETDGVEVTGQVVQSRHRPDPATYLGAGKAGEVAALVRERGAAVVIADGELSPAQARNLEDIVHARVVDRTALILDIFAQHAQSSE